MPVSAQMAKALSFSPSAVPAILRLLADKAPHTTLSELLADPSIGTQARSLTLADLARALGGVTSGGAVSGGAVSAERGRPGPKPAAAQERSAAPATRRSPSDKYDAAVLVEILAAPEPVGAVAVREKVGGTPAQFRSAVERLMEARKISKSGIAKGTRYRVA